MSNRDGTVVAANFARAARMLLPALLVTGVAIEVMAAAQRPAMASNRPGLASFASDAELRAFLKRARPAVVAPPSMVSIPSPVVVASAPLPPPAAASGVVVTSQRAANPSITNSQEKGVDEGGILKQRGDTLVILRRGRLFTVSLANGGMRPVDKINAFPPGTDGGGSWYDEMLLVGDRVIVVGYSYARGGTEVNRFRLDAAGQLRFEDAHQLRSNDYYSSRNYASRVIGDRLIFYTPLDLDRDNPFARFPAVRRWRGDGNAPFQRIASARRIYIPPVLRDGCGAELDTLHTVTTCDLSAPDLTCEATGVLGASSRTFYVSARAVYLWISDAWSRRTGTRAAGAFIYRLPLDGSRPSAIAARGGPVDQFSFQERGGELAVLVRSEGGDDRMWRPEVSEGDVALLRVPLTAFGDGSREVARNRYRLLPGVGSDGWSFHNRFVGDYVLYGTGETAGRGPGPVYVAPIAGGAVATVPLVHRAERIDALGTDAVVIGNDARGALHFAAIELGRGVRRGDDYALPGARQGEERSHAFFYNAATPDGASGTLGLPVARQTRGVDFSGEGSASMLFLNRHARRFAPGGTLDPRAPSGVDDGCKASCVDWYGNARPIFTGGLVFALIGYELVEGTPGRDGQVREVRRVDFTPRRRG